MSAFSDRYHLAETLRPLVANSVASVVVPVVYAQWDSVGFRDLVGSVCAEGQLTSRFAFEC